MSRDPQDIKSLLNSVRQVGGAQDAPPPKMPDFDTFFEKLSNIDEISLADTTESPSPAPGTASPPPKAKPAPRAKMSATPLKKRQMQVLRSDFIQPEGRTPPHRSLRSQGKPQQGIPAGVITFFKLASAAVLLFSVGLGSGWIALSLPGKPQEGFAAITPAPVHPIVTDEVQALPIENNSKALSAGKTLQTAPASVSQPKLPDPAANGSATTAAPAADRPQYAIQVGACNSPACVAAYRKLLLGHVSSEAIQVIERTGTGAGNQSAHTVQRVRVVSSNASAAKKLKADLAAADTRFKDAYVIALPSPPSS